MLKSIFLVIGISIALVSLFFTTSCSCNLPKCREVVRCDKYGDNCHIVRERRFLVESNFQSSNFVANEYVGIIDLANQWQIDTSQPLQATIKFENQNTLLW